MYITYLVKLHTYTADEVVNNLKKTNIVKVAYTADEVEYKWLEGASPVGYEGELQLSQVEICKSARFYLLSVDKYYQFSFGKV